MTTKTIVKLYADYVIAYGAYIDKYMVNMREEDAVAEIEVCDKLYAELSEMVMDLVKDEGVFHDLMDILARTDFHSKKISMAENLKNFFNYLD